jgi:hypothetical protein
VEAAAHSGEVLAQLCDCADMPIEAARILFWSPDAPHVVGILKFSIAYSVLPTRFALQPQWVFSKSPRSFRLA